MPWMRRPSWRKRGWPLKADGATMAASATRAESSRLKQERRPLGRLSSRRRLSGVDGILRIPHAEQRAQVEAWLGQGQAELAGYTVSPLIDVWYPENPVNA